MSLSVSVRKLVACGCCWLTIASAPLVIAQSVVTEGAEYSAAGSLPGDQTFPQAAISPDGGYLVWQDNAFTAKGLRIRAVRLDASLAPSGSPFPVSGAARSRLAGNQEKPQVALLNEGAGAVVVWQGGKPGCQRIWARFLRANGSFLTGDLSVSTQRKINQTDPKVATLADGNVVIVWSSEGQDGSMRGIFARVYSPAGKPLGSEFQVNQFTSNNQRNPAVAPLANGQFVVVWISELQRTLGSVDVYARIFDALGAAVAGEFPVNASTTNHCANPGVAGTAAGRFAVVWAQNDTPAVPVGSPADNFNGGNIASAAIISAGRSTNGWDVFGGLFSDSGTDPIGPFRLNAYTYGDQFVPQVCALGTNYMAVWTSLDQDNDPRDGVFGRLLTGSGALAPVMELHVNTGKSFPQIHPTAAADGIDRFLVTWASFVAGGSSFDVLSQQCVLSSP